MTGSQLAGDELKEFGYDPPLPAYMSAYAQAKVSVCYMQVPPIPPQIIGKQGTASLCQLADDVFSAITNNHVLPITNAELISRIVFSFAGLGPVRFSEKDIKCCTTSEKLDATVIELTSECVINLQKRGTKFIRLASARERDQIALAQYPEGALSFDKGIVHEINENELYYYLGDAKDSSGSPILLWDFKAIGIHKECAIHKENALGPLRCGINLLAIAGYHLTASRGPSPFNISGTASRLI